MKDRKQAYEALLSRYKSELRSASVDNKWAKIVEALSMLRASIESGYAPEDR